MSFCLAEGWGKILNFLCGFFFVVFFLIKVNVEIKNYMIMGVGSLKKLLSMDLCPRLCILKRCTGVPRLLASSWLCGDWGLLHAVRRQPFADVSLRCSC